jgi:hypothetical protein
MHVRHINYALFSLAFTMLGCKDKPAPEGVSVRPDIPPPAPSATAVVTATPSASALEQAPPPQPAQPAGPKFVVRHHAPKEARLFWLGKAVIACSDSLCRGDASAVTEKGIVDTYEPTSAIQLRHPEALQLDGPVWSYLYSGNYPEVCVTVLYHGDRDNSRGVTLRRSGKTWIDGTCYLGSPDDEHPEVIQRPPRELDDALLHAPVADAAKTILRGAHAPPMLVTKRALHVWDGKAWSTQEGPWKPHDLSRFRLETVPSTEPVRLTNGATLVLEGGYYIDAKGEIAALQLIQDDKPVAANVEIVGAIWEEKAPWIVAIDDGNTYIASRLSEHRFSDELPVHHNPSPQRPRLHHRPSRASPLLPNQARRLPPQRAPMPKYLRLR